MNRTRVYVALALGTFVLACSSEGPRRHRGASQICYQLDDGMICVDAQDALDGDCTLHGDRHRSRDDHDASSASDADGDSSSSGPLDSSVSESDGEASSDGDSVSSDSDSESCPTPPPGAMSWFVDLDTDGFGDPAMEIVADEQPPGTVDNGLDCDDTDDAVNPDATEVCNGRDDDCSGVVDDNAADAIEWYRDADGDGFGDPAVPTLSCTQPDGSVINDDDCDDADGAVHPGAAEVANGVDDDCDGEVDEG